MGKITVRFSVTPFMDTYNNNFYLQKLCNKIVTCAEPRLEGRDNKRTDIR